MDLSTNSIGWHRMRRWLDDEIERLYEYPESDEGLTQEQIEYRNGLRAGMFAAFAQVRSRFNTPEENELAEQTRRDMFG